MSWAVRAELYKVVSLRMPVVTGAATVLLTAALSWALTWAAGQPPHPGDAAGVGGLDPESALTLVLHQAQLGVILFAAWPVVEEQDDGSLRTSLSAVPDRKRFFAAKCTVSAFGSLLMAGLTVPMAVLIRSSVVNHSFALSTDQDIMRAMIGYTVYWTLLGLMTTCLAFTVRNGIAAAGIMAALILVASPLLLPRTHWARFLPDQLGAQLYQADPWRSTDLGPALGLSVLLAWVLVGVAGGIASLRSWAPPT